MTPRVSKSLIIALIVGALFPYFWIVGAGQGEVVDKSLVDHAYANNLSPEKTKEYYESRKRPMTIVEKLNAGLVVATSIWQMYLFFSCLVATIVFVINLFIWPRFRKSL